jgi:four helix bundle protein
MWNKAQDFAAAIANLAVKLPRNPACNVISAQLMRSAASIGANIAEGYGRYSQPAYRSHLSFARGSACESESWLDLLRRLDYLSEGEASDLYSQCDELERMLTARMKSLGEGRTYAVKEESGEYDF